MVENILKPIFIYVDVPYIQYSIGKGFGSREIIFSEGVNSYFSPRTKKIPNTTPNYVPWQSNFEIGYYIQTYCFPEKLAYI